MWLQFRPLLQETTRQVLRNLILRFVGAGMCSCIYFLSLHTISGHEVTLIEMVQLPICARKGSDRYFPGQDHVVNQYSDRPRNTLIILPDEVDHILNTHLPARS